MRRALALTVLVLAHAATAAAAPPALTNLDPGGRVSLDQEIPVTVVYVGLEPGTGPTGIDAGAVEAAQPLTADPVVRSMEAVGRPRPLGLHYRLSYRSVFADTRFEDAFFGHLAAIASPPLPPTGFQSAYSDQPGAREQIAGNVVIDAVQAEKWLATNAGPMLGVDTTRPTVFFVNWHGRPDFRFHTYASPHEQPGIDTPIGATSYGQLTAWGGSTADDPEAPLPWLARVWFYDVSAGPDALSANYDLLGQDPDADGYEDNRIPPVWEYGTDHWYRPFDDLGGDLGTVLRFVAVNGMFVASPAYDPALSPPLLADHVEIDLNRFDATGSFPDTTSSLVTAPITASLKALDPTRGFSLVQRNVPFDRATEHAHECFKASYWYQGPTSESCFAGVSSNAFDLAHQLDSRRGSYVRPVRYALPAALIDTLDHRWFGFDAWSKTLEHDGTGIQDWALAWETPWGLGNLLGATTLLTAEAGRHLGLAETATGYDTEYGFDYGPYGDLYVAWLGAAVASPMTTLQPESQQFSQFERDSSDRWQTAVRLQWADRILADVYASPRADRATAELTAADAAAGRAATRLREFDLRGAAVAARNAYHRVLAAAELAGVRVEPWPASADQGAQGLGAWAADPVLHDSAAAKRAAPGAPAGLRTRSGAVPAPARSARASAWRLRRGGEVSRYR